MISITVNEMINIYGTLNELMSKNFSGKNAFNIARLARELNKELETFDQARKQVVDKYTLRDSAGNPVVDEQGNIKVIPDKVEECNQDFSTLLNSQLELNAPKLDESILTEIGDITPAQAMALEPIIDFK